MNNVFCIVGRISEISERKVRKDGVIVCTIKVSTTRNFKDENGEYKKDNVKVLLRGTLYEKLNEYCNVGDMIGVKGRIEETNKGNSILVGDKITFLSHKVKGSDDKCV